jgi:hypothetical protein
VIVRPEGVKDSALPPKGSKEYEQEQARLDKVASRPLPDYGLTGIPEQIEIPDQVQRLNALLVSIFGLDPQNLKLPNFRFVSGRTQTEWYYGRQVMTYPHPTDVPETAWEYFIRLPDGGRMECPADPADYPETWPEEWKSLPIGVEVVRKQKGDPAWWLESWRPPAVICANWREDIHGPTPWEGAYTPVWRCQNPDRSPRLPDESDLARLAELVALQQSSPTLKNHRWDAGFDANVFNDRLDRDLKATEQARLDAVEGQELVAMPAVARRHKGRI